MHKIKFSTNWNNKLECEVFTTFRIHYPGKYYVGNLCEIWLRSSLVCKARIEAIHVLKLEKVTPFMAYIDTGYGLDDFEKIVESMYGRRFDVRQVNFALILLKKIKEKPLSLFTDKAFTNADDDED